MRTARVVRLIFRIFLLICTLSLSIVSILGGLSAWNILMTGDNVDINFSSVTVQITDPAYVDIPFSIKNDGYFDLTDLEVAIVIHMDYNNSAGYDEVYNDAINFGDIKKTETFIGSYNATPLNIPNVNPSQTAWFEMDFTLNAWYSHRLLNIRIIITNETYPIFP